jgi:hypothetical protein
MTSYINRSPFAVSVTNRPDLNDEFPPNEEARALDYEKALKAKGFKPGSRRGGPQSMRPESRRNCVLLTFA